MKKALFLLALTPLFTCSRDNFKEIIDQSSEASVNLSVNLGNFFLGGTGSESPWVHQYQSSIDITFSSTTSTFTKTVTFNPNDPASFPSTSLPYDAYTWSIANTGNNVAVSSELYVYGTSQAPFSVGTPTFTLPLVLSTDFALVTVTTENLTSATIQQNGISTPLTAQDGYFYGYINSNISSYTVSVNTLDDLGGSDTIENPVPSTHYNYDLIYDAAGQIGVTVTLSDTFILEDRQILINSDGDADLDGIPNSLDLCPNTRIGAPVSANGCLDVLELDANGVTIKAKAGAQVGDVQEFNGATYTVVDDTTIREFLSDPTTAPYLVTTFVTDMEYLFNGLLTFNEDISSWDTSNVISMAYMFQRAHAFNQDISNWNVTNVQNMSFMFTEALAFNQNIGDWNVSNVLYMNHMFMSATMFNQNIESWDTSKVLNMTRMFLYAINYNQPLGNWDVSNVQNMAEMFFDAIAFNQDLGNWNVSNVTNMYRMFIQAFNYNQDLSGWNVTNVGACAEFSASTTSWTLPKPNFTNCTE